MRNADDIDAEFEHHLAASAEALARSGLPHDAAQREAELRFGDRRTHHRRCMRHSIEARMARMKVIGGVLLLACVAAIGADGWRRAVSAQHRLRELEAAFALGSSTPSRVLAPLAADAPILDAADRASVSKEATVGNRGLTEAGHPTGSVKVIGAVPRGGLYALNAVPTLRTLLDTAGWPERGDAEIELRRPAVEGSNGDEMFIAVRASSLREGTVGDVALRARDTVRIGFDVPRGMVYVDGAIARPGVYQLPDGGRLTALRLLAAAGGAGTDHSALELRLIRVKEVALGERTQQEYRLSAKDAEAFAMEPDDHLIVGHREAGVPPSAAHAP